MRATEIIRNVLDLIDEIECQDNLTPPDEDPILTSFTDIFNQLSAQSPSVVSYDNTPDVHVQGIDSVTTAAGGGWNGPKNPADHRTDSISLYPNFQARG